MKKSIKHNVTCSISKQSFQLNGKETFLYSGEVHYFRIPRRYWAKHLKALVDAGCNAVSTYVPWSWHEFKEGTIDLTGRTHPERDIAGFVDLAAKLGLYVTVKPGPYVMAETTDQGIPQWLTDDYPETLALDENGNPWGPAFISYANPLFRAKAEKWLKIFSEKIVVPRQARKRGAIIMMQLCNEIGMFQWLGSRGEYSPSNLDAWHRYLKAQHPDIRELSVLLDREIARHEDVVPPHEVCETRREFALYRLWHDFHRWLYADYVKFISDALREAGVTVPFFTNVGGWVFGRAHEFALNGTFHRETAKVEPDVLYGLDHIPEFVSQLNEHDGIVANQIAAELQRGFGPLYSAELQCGSREHGVLPYPAELALFYRLCIIHGLTGMNFYMFSQGRNPKGRGSDGPMFYWYNAVDYKGERQPTYPVVRELGEWLKVNGDFLCRAKRPASLAVAFYPHQYETEFLVPILGKQSRINTGKLGLSLDPVGFRDRALFDGVIRILVKKSIPYDFADITVRSVENLRQYKTLTVLANDIMDAKTQEHLYEYVRSGGKLVLFPMLPKYDLDFRPCEILGEKLGLKIKGRSTSNRVYMNQLKDIPVPSTPWILSDKGARALARDVHGNVVGVEKKVGKGTVRFFGFSVNYGIEEHPDLWSAMMELPGIDRNAWTDNDLLSVEARFADRQGMLFVGNFHRMPISAHVQVKDPRGGRDIDLGKLDVDGLTGLMLPIQVNATSDLTVVYAYGELLGGKKTARGAQISLRGPRGTKGRMALKGRASVRSITVDGQPVAFATSGGVTTADYIQTGLTQTIEVRM